MNNLGYYITCDDAMCLDCLQAQYGDDDSGYENSTGFVAWRQSGGFEDWPEPVAIFREEESDSPTHCMECQELIPHALTPDGYAYVEDAAREDITAIGNDTTISAQSVKTVHAWIDEYGDDGVNGIVVALHNALYEAMEDADYFDTEENIAPS